MLFGMFKNGYANLYRHEKEINDLNVFPVADGDTGVNMRLTLENGIASTKENANVGVLLKGFSNGVLFGARGNSGVILSQIIKGWAVTLRKCQVIGVGELRNAMINGYKQAYSAVSHPVEGTILTVAREGIENIRGKIGRGTTIEDLFSMYIKEMRSSLQKTPELLDVLKKADVVDSGAVGYITIIEGMFKYLFGQTLDIPDPEAKTQESVIPKTSAETTIPSGFDENSRFELGYCTEFVLQLLKNEPYRQDFDIKEFTDFLDKSGESTVCVKDGTIVKVHVHTLSPEKIIEKAREFGEFLSIHIDNMQIQHDNRLGLDKQDREETKKPLAVITVANGGPICEILKELGCDKVIDVGPNMNVSPSEFIKALSELNAENIVILPNNKNTVSSANQAVSLYEGGAKTVVIPTTSVIEGYCAIAMDIPDDNDVAHRISGMISGAKDVHTLSVAIASKDYSDESVTASKGQFIALIDDKIVACRDSVSEALLKGLALHPDINEKNICLIINGEGTEDMIDEIEDAVSERFPDLEVNTMFGGQSVQSFIVGLI